MWKKYIHEGNVVGQRCGALPIDETGNRYGRLVVVSRSANKYKTRAAWSCRCECGRDVIVDGNSLRYGKTLSCGCYKVERAIETHSMPLGQAGRNRAIAAMKANARTNKRAWDLTDAEATVLMESPCHYCGAPPGNEIKVRSKLKGRGDTVYLYSGIDRINSNIGYLADNVVSCCWICNRAKGNLSIDEFLVWRDRIACHVIVLDKSKSTEGSWKPIL